MGTHWDDWHMEIAHVTAKRSKDPSTKVGARIVRPDNSAAGHGYNGFPRGVADTEERLNDRPTKYALTIHAEMNAILDARERLTGYKMYTTFMPCDRCFLHCIQAGIRHFVFPKPTPEQEVRWGESFAKVRALAKETGVILQTHDIDDDIDKKLRDLGFPV